MLQKVTFFIITILSCWGSSAQKSKVHQLSITTDNDAYLGKLKDGYYSSGFFIHYRFANTAKQPNVLRELTLTHKIFTPQGRVFYLRNGIDRPFCGLLSLAYSQTKFVKQNTMHQWEANVATIGKNALGENVQQYIHRVMGFRQHGGWENQLQNELGINGRYTIAKHIFSSKKKQWYQVVPMVEATVGNTFTYAKVGTFISVGWMNKLNNGALFNAQMLSTEANAKKKFELFFSFQPQLTAYAYNATVQGGLFTNDANANNIHRLVYQQNWQIVYAEKNFTGKLGVSYLTPEGTLQQRPQRFGTISIGYQF